jgi:type VI secretion system ImpB/VipA family protein
MTSGSQKFIARNRAPRVQIEYEVELYGSQKKVQLPFVMGVMSDLVGKSKVAQPEVEDRSFLEIDTDNFDDRMRTMAPRAAFTVPNTLTGEGNVAVDLTFEKLDDFSPASIAAKVESLRPLLEARTQLSNLMAYMDGKAGAEALIEKILADPALLSAVSNATVEAADQSAVLESLRNRAPAENPTQDEADDILANLASQPIENTAPKDTGDAALARLRDSGAGEDMPEIAVQDTLAKLAENAPQQVEIPDVTTDALNSLAEIDVPEGVEDTTDELLADLAAIAPEAEPETGPISDDLDDLLADITASTPEPAPGPDTTKDAIESLLDMASPEVAMDVEEGDIGDIDLDDLLGDLEVDDDIDLDELVAEPEASEENELSNLLADLADSDSNDLDTLLADDPKDESSDLGDTLTDLGSGGASSDMSEQSAEIPNDPEFAFGQISDERPEPERLNRKRFRMAIMGDFSGRAAKGLLETGDALATRRPIPLDPDTVEDVIKGFATDLVLPVGKDGAGVAVKLRGLDDLHPDELYDNVDLFAELVGLRGQLANGATAESAARQLRLWGEKHGKPVTPTHTKSAGNTVPADCRLSDFQKLIGDTNGSLLKASPLDELMARIVGPHIRAIPDADAIAMQGAVDQALSAAMRLVLHHPEFQSIEAQWRSIDLIARSIEADDTLDVILYDISAEEIAADLAISDDLTKSGFARLLTEQPLDEENGRGGYSALIGLYTFEETPPHAELLGRIARLAAHVDAPFFAALTPAFLDTAKEDRHMLVANAWDTLRGMPEAGHLGLVSPRFLLRRPYGAKSEPIYEFAFEEFTMTEGLKGMLWANPVVLVAILLAKSFRENGADMDLGSIMSLGDMPYHYVNDQYGDQVALPCTERNLTLDKIEMAVTRGIMSVAAIKGRDEIRLTSFGSLAGDEILGPWAKTQRPDPSPPNPDPVVVEAEVVDSDNGSDDDMDLDDLLAGFGDDLDLDDGDDTDAELAALLDDL